MKANCVSGDMGPRGWISGRVTQPTPSTPTWRCVHVGLGVKGGGRPKATPRPTASHHAGHDRSPPVRCWRSSKLLHSFAKHSDLSCLIPLGSELSGCGMKGIRAVSGSRCPPPAQTTHIRSKWQCCYFQSCRLGSVENDSLESTQTPNKHGDAGREGFTCDRARHVALRSPPAPQTGVTWSVCAGPCCVAVVRLRSLPRFITGSGTCPGTPAGLKA